MLTRSRYHKFSEKYDTFFYVLFIRSDFQSIHLLNITRNTAYIKWTGEWATFLDSLLQLNVFPRDHDGVSTPVTIKKLSINVDGHKYEDMTTLDGNTCYKARMTNFNTLVK